MQIVCQNDVYYHSEQINQWFIIVDKLINESKRQQVQYWIQ